MVHVEMEQTLENLDDLRRRLGILQADMCRRADVSESTISKCRTSGREPTRRIRGKLARALRDIADERGVALVEDGGSQ